MLRHCNARLESEIAVTNAKSYTIGIRFMTKADFAEIRNTIYYWNKKVIALENAKKRGGRNRAYRAVPRDL